MKKKIEDMLSEVELKMSKLEADIPMFCISVEWIVANAKRQVLCELLTFCK